MSQWGLYTSPSIMAIQNIEGLFPALAVVDVIGIGN
jgi:hypothetical protein